MNTAYFLYLVGIYLSTHASLRMSIFGIWLVKTKLKPTPKYYGESYFSIVFMVYFMYKFLTLISK